MERIEHQIIKQENVNKQIKSTNSRQQFAEENRVNYLFPLQIATRVSLGDGMFLSMLIVVFLIFYYVIIV